MATTFDQAISEIQTAMKRNADLYANGDKWYLILANDWKAVMYKIINENNGKIAKYCLQFADIKQEKMGFDTKLNIILTNTPSQIDHSQIFLKFPNLVFSIEKNGSVSYSAESLPFFESGSIYFDDPAAHQQLEAAIASYVSAAGRSMYLH